MTVPQGFLRIRQIRFTLAFREAITIAATFGAARLPDRERQGLPCGARQRDARQRTGQRTKPHGPKAVSGQNNNMIGI